MTNRAAAIVEAAEAGGFAVPALCVYNIEGMIGGIRAAEAKKSPLILQLFPWAVEYADSLLVHAAAEAARKAKVPVAVHMDHCQSPEMVKRAADMGGFDGIMIDMSHYEKKENLQKTAELVKYCHERGIITEAEPGRINGGEDGVADTVDLEEVLTTVDQAEDFLALGIDWLAPAFGNVHGNYGPKGPQLEYDRLEKLHRATKGRVSLVLHGAGTKWFDQARFEECISRGIRKININDAFNDPFVKAIQDPSRKTLISIIESGTNAVQMVVEQHMDWMGSSGKADSVHMPE